MQFFFCIFSPSGGFLLAIFLISLNFSNSLFLLEDSQVLSNEQLLPLEGQLVEAFP